MRKLAVLFAMILLTVPGISMAVEEIITGPDWESPFVDRDSNDPFDSADDDLSFPFAETESGQASLSMTLTSATVTFDPKKKDKFVLKGTTGSLSLTGATSVIFEAGSFKQEITLGKFTKSKEKYTFKGATGAAGIASLILDMPKGQFSATVQNLFLTGFNNPLPVSLKAGTTAECSMAQFSVNKNKWTFSGSGNPQYACLISQTPQATPRGLFVNQAKDVKVQVQVPSNPALDKNNVKLIQVDESLNVIGGPLCTLLDNGNPANGDATAGDNTYSCIANLQEETAGKLWLMVQAQLGEKATYSPSFSLDVVTPYTQEEAQKTVAAHESALQVWEQNLSTLGDTKKAKDATIKSIKGMDGVKNAGLSQDGGNIWIEFESGIWGGLLLSPIKSGNRGAPTVRTLARGPGQNIQTRAENQLSTPLSNCNQVGDSSGGNAVLPDCSIFMWDPDRDLEHNSLYDLFREIVPDTRVGSTIYSGLNYSGLTNLTQYGTVYIRAQSTKGAKAPIVFETAELPGDFVLANLFDERVMLDLLTGCLERWISWDPDTSKAIIRYFFTPTFISTLEGDFKNSVVFFNSPNSSEIAPIFLKKKAHTFFGFKGDYWDGYSEDIPKQLFASMLKEGKDTGEAFEALPKNSETASSLRKFSSTGEISYDCGPASGRLGLQMNSHFTYQPPIGPPYTYDQEKGYYAGGSAPDFAGQFVKNAFNMTWNFTKNGIHYAGKMEVTLDNGPRDATKVISFLAEENREELTGERSILYMTTKGENIGITSTTNYGIYFELKGPGVCSHVTKAEGYMSSNKTDGFHEYWFNGFECNDKSYLNLYFDFIK